MLCIKNTKEGAELLVEFCAGSLDPARASELETHIASCTECRELVDGQRALWETLECWTPPAVSPDFNLKLFGRIAAEEQSGWRKWLPGVFRPAVPYSIWKPAALVAACAVLVVGFLVRPAQAPDAVAQVDAEKVDIEQVANALEELDMLMPAHPAHPAAGKRDVN
jgi:hypothetical protein